MNEQTQHDADSTARVAQAAARLRDAGARRVAAPPVRDVLGTTDVTLAYRVQNELTAGRVAGGAAIIGRKIGLTSPAVQQQLGVDQPDFGVLFDDMTVPDGGLIDSSTLIQPKAEAEVAFVLAADLDGDLDHLDRKTVEAAVAYAVAALEIVDSRNADWDITITDTVADNASSALYVLGETRVPLAEFSPKEVVMTLEKDGVLASSGDGAACLGDPLEALLWLAKTVAALGAPLRAGEVVLSGALGPMVTAGPGSEVVAELSSLGRVAVRFSD